MFWLRNKKKKFQLHTFIWRPGCSVLFHGILALHNFTQMSIWEVLRINFRMFQKALSSVPGAEHLLIRQQRSEADVMCKIYLEDKAAAEKELS